MSPVNSPSGHPTLDLGPHEAQAPAAAASVNREALLDPAVQGGPRDAEQALHLLGRQVRLGRARDRNGRVLIDLTRRDSRVIRARYGLSRWGVG
jgi:hypothetical protein